MILNHYYRFKLMRLITTKWIAKPIYAAVELELADIISDKKTDIAWLANKTKSQPDLLYRLLRTLVSTGIFKEVEDKKFITTPMGKLLRKDKLGPMILMFQSDWHDKAWNMLSKTIKTGVPGFELAHGQEAFAWFENNPAESQVFNNANYLKAQMLSGLLDKYNFKQKLTVADIGGGYGGLLIEVLKKNSHLNGIILDLEHLRPMVVDKIKDHKLEKRCKFTGGDFFKEIPVHSDVYLLCNILHDWDDVRCLDILKNCHAIMKKESTLLIIEMIVPKGNCMSVSKLMDLEVLVMGGGKERTKIEFMDLLNLANLKIKKISKKNNYNIIECSKKNKEYKL
ncbi:MAG: hypothetical protein GY707_06170 [Desulfobacteraceae bacterium]|nr:hypothetical protein [Desulfobacteraceae bacterium]